MAWQCRPHRNVLRRDLTTIRAGEVVPDDDETALANPKDFIRVPDPEPVVTKPQKVVSVPPAASAASEEPAEDPHPVSGKYRKHKKKESAE